MKRLLVVVLFLVGCDGRALEYSASSSEPVTPCHNNDDCRATHGRCVYFGCFGGGGQCVRVVAGEPECGGSQAACCVDSSGAERCQAGHFCQDGICVGCRR